MIAVIAGGVGAARFCQGLVQITEPSDVSVVINVADDFVLHGLKICPDIDTVRSTLAGDVGPQGWGRANESWIAMTELAALALQAPSNSRATDWFSLGDRDLATHLYRSQRLSEGAGLGEVTHELTKAAGVNCRLMPASEDVIATQVLTESGWVDFQHYFVGLKHSAEVKAIRFEGIANATPAPGVADVLKTASTIVFAPSNPFVSTAPVVEIAEVDETIRERRADVVGVSPIVGGQAIKGPAADMFRSAGLDPSPLAVAQLWAPYCSTLVIDNVDRRYCDDIAALGVTPVVTNTVMTTPQDAAALAQVVIDS